MVSRRFPFSRRGHQHVGRRRSEPEHDGNNPAQSFELNWDPLEDHELDERGRLKRPSGAAEEQHPAPTWRHEGSCWEGGSKPTALATLL